MSTISSPFIRSIMTIGELPTQFTESMSYYEALVWLTNYIENTVIPAINNDAEVIKDLKDYVIHYFDSLDVQEQVNEKLDEMAESGQLQEIMADFFDAFPLTSDKIADNAITSSKIADGAVVDGKIGTDAVSSTNITDGAVTASKLASDSVTEAKIADGSVTTSKLGAAAVTSAKMASNAVLASNIVDGAVTSAKIASNAVTTPAIANGAVTNDKIANKTIAANKLNITNFGQIQLGDVLIQSGWFTVENVPTDQQVDYTFTFPTIFEGSPVVMTQVGSWRNNPFCWIYQTSATGFTARVGHNQGSTVSLTFMWTAIGKKTS